MTQIWTDEDDGLETSAEVLSTGDIRITQEFVVQSPISQNHTISESVVLSSVKLSEIFSAAVGKTIGKMSRQELNFSFSKDQLYEFLREQSEPIGLISTNPDYAEQFLRAMFMYPEAERGEPHYEFDQAELNEQAVILIRAMASAVVTELIDREPAD